MQYDQVRYKLCVSITYNSPCKWASADAHEKVSNKFTPIKYLL